MIWLEEKYGPHLISRPTFFPSAVVRLVSTGFSDFPSNLLISDRKDMSLVLVWA